MPISIKCPKCGQGYRVREELAGKRAKCKCGAALAIPQPPPAPEPDPMMDLLDQEFPEEAGTSLPGGSPAAASPARGLPPVAGPLAKKPSKKAGINPVLVAGIAAGGVVGLVLVGLVIFLSTRSGDSPASGPARPASPATPIANSQAPRGAGYATPEEAYEAQKKAFLEKDWKTLLDTLTPESQDWTVGMTAVMAVSVAGKNQQAADLLKQHGIDETMWKEESPEEKSNNLKDAANAFKKIRQKQKALVAAIDDKRAFFLVAMDHMPQWTETLGNNMGQDLSQVQAQAEQAQATAKLSDVQIEADHATGKQSLTLMGRTLETPVHFKRINGRWYIHLPDAMME